MTPFNHHFMQLHIFQVDLWVWLRYQKVKWGTDHKRVYNNKKSEWWYRDSVALKLLVDSVFTGDCPRVLVFRRMLVVVDGSNKSIWVRYRATSQCQFIYSASTSIPCETIKKIIQETRHALGFFVTASSAKVNVFMYLNGLKWWYNHHFVIISCINIQRFPVLAFLL